jgi:hypothetical protein
MNFIEIYCDMRLEAGIVESGKTAMARQRLVEPCFRSNKYAGINQSVTQIFTPCSGLRLPKTHSHVNRDSTEVSLAAGNLGITRLSRYNG